MDIPRRALLRGIGTGAVAAAVPSLRPAAGLAENLDSADRPVSPVRLHRNENAFGPSAAVLAAMRAACSSANHYPEVEEETFRTRLANLHGVSPDAIVVGCGSSEILYMAAAAFAGPGKNVVVAMPTCDLMAEFARRSGAAVFPVALTSHHAHDLDAMLARVNRDTALVYVCNPNNPTGTLTGRQQLDDFLRRLTGSTRVIVDEAYHDYAIGASEYASFIDRPAGDSRIIVTRTLSAIHGLAGLRIGYAVAAPDLAAELSRWRMSNGVNAVAATAAIAALEDVDHVRASARRNANDRQEFFNHANARMLRRLDSHANFVMLNVERNAADVIEHFKRNGVLVGGPFPSMPKYIRVSVGAPDQMRTFWRVWDLLPHQMPM
jgi:histidinol-phosphate aminotransferase